MKKPEKPKPPLCRIIREPDFCNDKCEFCGSSMKLKFIFFQVGGCINQKCKNFYRNMKEKG